MQRRVLTSSPERRAASTLQTLFASSCLLEGATWRNAAGEEASERVVDECYQEAKRAMMPYHYSPEVLRVRMSDTRRRAAL